MQFVIGPLHVVSKSVFLVVVVALTYKTFFFLRIIPALTPVVVMLTNVIYDLRIFLTFYLILLLFCTWMYSVIDLGTVDDSKYTIIGRLLAKKGGGGGGSSG